MTKADTYEHISISGNASAGYVCEIWVEDTRTGATIYASDAPGNTAHRALSAAQRELAALKREYHGERRRSSAKDAAPVVEDDGESIFLIKRNPNPAPLAYLGQRKRS